MRFSVDRDLLLPHIQFISNLVGSKPSAPILSHVLMELNGQSLALTGSDGQVEYRAELPAECEGLVKVTLPAEKVFNICRFLPDKSQLSFEVEDHMVRVQSDRFKSKLKSLPFINFPTVDLADIMLDLRVPANLVMNLLGRVEFAMAHRDVRQFFNGLLLQFDQQSVTAVATNGQRLARVSGELMGYGGRLVEVILPRKTVIQLLKLLPNSSELLLSICRQQLRVVAPDLAAAGEWRFTTGLIDAAYPDYTRAIPDGGDKVAVVQRHDLRDALGRMLVVSNDLFRFVNFHFEGNQLRISASNQLKEEAEEFLTIDYSGEPLEIGLNISYVLDVLQRMKGELVKLILKDSGSPVLLQDPSDSSHGDFVVSPMVH